MTGEASGCYDCGAPYGTWPDLLVPDAAWLLISPTGHEGGLLCPVCIIRRCEAAGIKDVPAAFASGPLRSVEYVEGTGMAFLNDLWPAVMEVHACAPAPVEAQTLRPSHESTGGTGP